MVIERLFFLLDASERNGIFRASLDAQPASFAGRCIDQNGLLPSMSKAFDQSFDAEIRSHFLGQGSNVKYSYRTDSHAFSFALASIAVNRRNKSARCVLAFGRLCHERGAVFHSAFRGENVRLDFAVDGAGSELAFDGCRSKVRCLVET